MSRFVIQPCVFKNAATQIVQTEQFLPLAPVQSDKSVSSGDYIFEPTKEEIVGGAEALKG